MTRATAPTERLVYGMRAARGPVFGGRDSETLICIVRTPDPEADIDRGMLSIVSPDGVTMRLPTPQHWDVQDFACRREADDVAVVEGERRRLVVGSMSRVVGAAGDGQWTSLAMENLDCAPAWSPTGDALAVTHRPTSTAGYVPEVVTRSYYKENGYGYIGASRRQVEVLDLNTRRSTLRTSEPEGASLPAWSPTGARLAVRIGVDAGWPWAKLAVVDPAGREPPQFMSGYTGTVEALMFWDAAKVIFVGSARRPWTGQADILVWDWQTDAVDTIAADLPWHVWSVGFNGVSPSPLVRRDEKTLWVGGNERSRSGLYAVDISSGTWELLYSSPDLRGGLATSRDWRRVVQETSSLNSVGELCEITLATRSERPLTHLNDAYFEARPKVNVTQIAVERPGLTLDAWIVRSASTSAKDGPQPLVLDVHGGPHNFWGEFFIPEHQALVENGVTVLYCNPRGSASYGPEFASATAGRWGEVDTDDIMCALREGLRQLHGDATVFLSGWSYGGFQVLTILSRFDDQFTAAICGAPAADFTSWYGSSDVGSTMVPEELGCRPFECPEYYRNASPAAYMHSVTTPLLLLHGLADLRSPIGQTELIHRILSDNGTPVRYVRYPAAAHAFRQNGRPSHRAHVLAEIVSWVTDWMEKVDDTP